MALARLEGLRLLAVAQLFVTACVGAWMTRPDKVLLLGL